MARTHTHLPKKLLSAKTALHARKKDHPCSAHILRCCSVNVTGSQHPKSSVNSDDTPESQLQCVGRAISLRSTAVTPHHPLDSSLGRTTNVPPREILVGTCMYRYSSTRVPVCVTVVVVVGLAAWSVGRSSPTQHSQSSSIKARYKSHSITMSVTLIRMI